MVKPIFIIKAPYGINMEDLIDLKNNLKKSDIGKDLSSEYHVLLFVDETKDGKFEFEVLNSDESDEVTMEKVKEIELLITKNIKNEKS